ncbi:MAG: hypothetical protein AB7V32_01660 [Candidatus Berkiella sp.]
MRFGLRFFTVTWGVLSILFAPVLKSSVDTTFLGQFFVKKPPFIEKAYEDTADAKLSRNIWHDLAVKSYCVRTASDSTLRPIFGQIQYHIEQHLLNAHEQFSPKSSLWIIHTPTIATPLVTKGVASPNLISTKNAKNKTAVGVALKRATLFREYLAKGGTLVVTKHGNLENNQLARTDEQLEIFEALKKQYPKQIIELTIRSKIFPVENMGATYIMSTPKDELIAITTQGVQINDSQDKATWGVWIKSKNTPDTNKKLTDNIQFLMRNGLQEALISHAHQHKETKDTYLALFKRL